MVQRYELDPSQNPEEQIRETDFNIQKGSVGIYYHYGKGKIVAKEKHYDRADLVGKARSDEGLGEKEIVQDAVT